jgi:GntR family transcriptional regulator/MocR family aminotransferase
MAPSTLYQVVLADFVDEGHLDRHVRRMRSLYLARRNALVRSLQQHADDLLTMDNIDAGMQLTAFLPPGLDDRDVVRLAADRGISANPLSRCYASQHRRNGLILGFACVGDDQIDQAAQTLADAIRGLV